MSLSSRNDVPAYSVSSQNAIISTSIVGGFFILALLIFVLYRKSQGKKSECCDLPVFHHPRKSNSRQSSSPLDDIFPQCVDMKPQAPVPVYPSGGLSQTQQNPSFRPMSSKSEVPTSTGSNSNRFTHRLEAANTSFNGFWGSLDRSTRLGVVKSEPKCKAAPIYELPAPTWTDPPMKGIDEYKSLCDIKPVRTRAASLDLIPSTWKEIQIDVPTSPPSLSSMMPVSTCTTRDSLPARWSWAGSQGPPTKRLGHDGLYTPSNRSSMSSLPRLKTIADWVRSQAARNHDSAPPLPFVTRRTSNLKNQAYKPTLIPTPARALTKPRLIRVGSISALSRPSTAPQDRAKPLPAPPVAVSPEVEKQQAKWNQKCIDLVQRDRTLE